VEGRKALPSQIDGDVFLGGFKQGLKAMPGREGGKEEGRGGGRGGHAVI